MVNERFYHFFMLIHHPVLEKLSLERMMKMSKKKEKFDNKFADADVARMRHDLLIPEEFTEGAFGSPINQHSMVENKSTEWEKGQRRASNFTYPDKEQHDDKPRQMPGAHPLHDE